MFLDVNLAAGSPTPPPRNARSLEWATALVESARPDLSPDSPEYQSAIILLLSADIGLNVDRMVLRAKLPREFVARCLRRLSDNACWVDGEMRTSWDDPPTCRNFWLDVEVALGRQLRRINAAGDPEWADIRGWVKDFNYKGMQGAKTPVTNDYYEITPHDPELVAPAEDPEPVPEPATGINPSFLWPGRLVPRPITDTAKWLGGSDDVGDSSEETEEGASASGSMLVDAWSGAGWLR